MMLKKYFMKSVNRITKDFKQRELLPLKLVFFVQASTISVLYPYLTIHMRELGISVEEAAIMSAVIPVIGIIMPPLAGMVADKIGNFKLLLAFFSLLGGAAALLLLLVPVGRITVTHPERITLNFGCVGQNSNSKDFNSGYFQLGLSQDILCEEVTGLNQSNVKEFKMESRLEGCGFACQSSYQTTILKPELKEYGDLKVPTDIILKARSYIINVKTGKGDKSYHYNLSKNDVPTMQTKEFVLSHRIMANDANLRTSIRKIAPSTYFFPAVDLLGLTCEKVPTQAKNESEENYLCYIKTPESGGGDGEKIVAALNSSLGFALRKISGANEKREFASEFADWSNSNESRKAQFTCGTNTSETREEASVFVYLHNPENNLEILETLPLSNCKRMCLASTLRNTTCTNLKEEVLYDPQLTFWIYLVIRVFIGIIGSTSYAMYEVAVIAILREQKADYGLQRIYASIGGMISSPLSGFLIDYASEGKGYTDFRPAFYLYAGLKISTSILMLFINLEFKKAAANVVSDAIKVLKNMEVIALLASCFVLGTAWGYIESFLFWFLEDLGGTRSLMGITITVGGIAGIPLLILSGPIIDKIGHANVLFIGFVFYAIRLVGYSLIYNPYHCLFFEAMESITSSLSFTAAVTYAAKLSTTTTDGSIQGLVGGLYFGVGRGAGSLIGGYLMKAVGTRPTYRIFAIFTIVTGILYYLFNKFCITKLGQVEGNDICKKMPKAENIEADVRIIAEKPNEEKKKYGTIHTDNNNTEKKKANESAGPEGKEKKDEKKLGDGCTNAGFVPDEDRNDDAGEEDDDEETKKKD